MFVVVGRVYFTLPRITARLCFHAGLRRWRARENIGSSLFLGLLDHLRCFFDIFFTFDFRSLWGAPS